MTLESIKGMEIRDVRRVPSVYPLFRGQAGETVMVVRQPVPGDIWRVKSGAQRVSKWTRTRYEMRNMPVKKEGDPQTICDHPPFQPGSTGWFFVVMEVDSSIIGFGRHHYQLGSHPSMKFYDCPPDAMVCEGSLCIADDWQRLGLGSLYGRINKLVCKTMGASFLVGTTFVKNGMMGIRVRDGFDVIWVSLDGSQVRVRGKL